MGQCPARIHRKFQSAVNDTFVRNGLGIKGRSFTPPEEHGEWLPYISEIINGISTVILQKVFETIYSFFKRMAAALEHSSDPVKSASFNCLHLPHTTWDAAQLLIQYLYTAQLPVPKPDEADTDLTFCHLHGLAVQLQINVLANYCMTYLTGRHVDLMKYDVATKILHLVLIPETAAHYVRLHYLILDMLTCPDAAYITTAVADTMQSIVSKLDRRSAIYVAKYSTRRGRALRLCSSPKGPTIDDIEVKMEVKIERTESVEPLAQVAFNDAGQSYGDPTSIPFHDQRMLCARYHWHDKGWSCFKVTSSDARINENAESEQGKEKSERVDSTVGDEDEVVGNGDVLMESVERDDE